LHYNHTSDVALQINSTEALWNCVESVYCGATRLDINTMMTSSTAMAR